VLQVGGVKGTVKKKVKRERGKSRDEEGIWKETHKSYLGKLSKQQHGGIDRMQASTIQNKPVRSRELPSDRGVTEFPSHSLPPFH